MRNPMGLRKGAWSEEEDFLLKKCVEEYGEGKWHQVPVRAGLNRCRKSCRLRWLNYLKPNLKRGALEEDEVDLIIKLHNLLGNRWSLIAGRLPGRTANDIKNYWNTYLGKRVSPPTKLGQNQKNERLPQKVNVIKPRPRTFTNGLSWMRGKATLVAYGGCDTTPSPNNFDKPSASLPSSENETNWWEDLLADGSGGNARIKNNALESDSKEELAAATRFFTHDLVAEMDIATSCKDDGPNASSNISFDQELWTFLEREFGDNHSDDTIPLI